MSSDILGTEKVQRLLFNLGWPAALNFSVGTIYNVTDVLFVGRWLGPLQIAAVVGVGYIVFLFSSVGLAIGVGGSSLISRALGEKDKTKASYVLGNQVILVLAFSVFILAGGFIFEDFVLRLFGANGDIFPYARSYFRILLFGTPLLSLSMIGNNIIQAQGKAKVAMFNSLMPTLVNLVLNPLFIMVFDMGIEGSAWATLIGYVLGFLLVLRFFWSTSNEVRLNLAHIKFDGKVSRQIVEIGSSIMANVMVANLVFIVLNQVLFKYEQESGVVIYGIINRVSTLFLIPMIGINGGIIPIIGYNFGSRQLDRVRDTIRSAIKYGTIICYGLFVIVFLSCDHLIYLFTKDDHIISMVPFAMKIVFSFVPLIVIHIIAEGYFQAIGKPQISFFLIVLRNIILLIPMLYILSYFFGYMGILYTFPIVDILTTIPTIWLLRNELGLNTPKQVPSVN